MTSPSSYYDGICREAAAVGRACAPDTNTTGRGVACCSEHATADGGKAVPFTKPLRSPCHVRDGASAGAITAPPAAP